MGIVYVLRNEGKPAPPEIDTTDAEPSRRLLAFDTTNVSVPYERYSAATVEDSLVTDKALQTAAGEHRVDTSHECFNHGPRCVAAQHDYLPFGDAGALQTYLTKPLAALVGRTHE